MGSGQGWWERSCAGREVSLEAGNQWLGVTCGRTRTWKIMPDHRKSRQKGQRLAKDSQREVFVMWSFERLEYSSAWEWGIEIAKKSYPATFSPNVFVEHVFSFYFCNWAGSHQWNPWFCHLLFLTETSRRTPIAAWVGKHNPGVRQKSNPGKGVVSWWSHWTEKNQMTEISKWLDWS